MSDHHISVTNSSPGRPGSGGGRPRFGVTRWLTLIALLALALGSFTAVAAANDASVKRALKRYEKKLTKDIGYLASFKTPTKRSSGSVLKRVSAIRRDLRGAEKAQQGEMASTANGRKGRQQILAALGDAGSAATKARASALAVRAGHRSAAKGDAKQELRDIDKAIVLFESGGKKLHLF